ncbi:MAG: TIGR03668 family PPOX class F420-dependent oxidoreductase [Myxococcota bacterium]
MEISDDAVVTLLARWPVARLATVGPGGAPTLVPVVFAPSGGRLWIPIDGKPKRGGELARVANVRRDPRVALLLDHYASDWSTLWWLRVDARAEVTRGAEPGAEAALREKYPQYATTPLFRGPTPTWLALTEERVRGWSASGDGLASIGGWDG